jgi:hypothetical protein
MTLLIHLPKFQNYPMQLIVVENQNKRITKVLLNLIDEPPSPSPSDSSYATFKHDDSSEEWEDDLRIISK